MILQRILHECCDAPDLYVTGEVARSYHRNLAVWGIRCWTCSKFESTLITPDGFVCTAHDFYRWVANARHMVEEGRSHIPTEEDWRPIREMLEANIAASRAATAV